MAGIVEVAAEADGRTAAGDDVDAGDGGGSAPLPAGSPSRSPEKLTGKFAVGLP
ncbi:MAG TPA: hypothetical protein VJU61_03605 [Polyangiaceae bacterium]|nr:hypothetical protein [Polyangiaceae bacterium]